MTKRKEPQKLTSKQKSFWKEYNEFMKEKNAAIAEERAKFKKKVWNSSKKRSAGGRQKGSGLSTQRNKQKYS